MTDGTTSEKREIVADLKERANALEAGELASIQEETFQRLWAIFQTTTTAQVTQENAAFNVGRMFEAFSEYRVAVQLLSRYNKALTALTKLEEKA